jgi:gamma-glutamyltranspeptidase/glutathione hydrolase
VAHGSRLTSLNTTRGHPNCIESGKRPRITLTPTLVLRGGKPVFAVSVAGGDLQDQTTLNVLLNAIDFGMPPREAVTAPRFATQCHQDSFNPAADRDAAMGDCSLSIDAGIGDDCASGLAAKGHRIARSEGPVGNPVMLHIEPDSGMVYAAGDPQADRHAAAMD